MATVDVTADPILQRFRAELDKAYGDRIERVVLFGSRARGATRGRIRTMISRCFCTTSRPGGMSLASFHIGTDILYDTGAVISAKPFAAGAYAQRTPLMHELRRDGVDF